MEKEYKYGLLDRWIKFIAVMACASVLAACGGGGGSAGTSQMASRYHVSFSSGEWTSIFFGGNDASYKVKLTKSSSSDPSFPDPGGQVVSLAASNPAAVIMPATVITDANGEAEFTVSAANRNFYPEPVTITASIEVGGYNYRANMSLNVNNRVDNTISTATASIMSGLGSIVCGDMQTYLVNVKEGDAASAVSETSVISVGAQNNGAIGAVKDLGVFEHFGKVWLIQVRPPAIGPLSGNCKQDGETQTGEVRFVVTPYSGAGTYYFGYYFTFNVVAP